MQSIPYHNHNHTGPYHPLSHVRGSHGSATSSPKIQLHRLDTFHLLRTVLMPDANADAVWSSEGETSFLVGLPSISTEPVVP